MKSPNSDYYQRPSTNPQIGQSIGNALQQFIAARQNQQKMALLQQSGLLEQQKAQWENPNRTPTQLDYLKAASNPYNTLAMMQAMQGGGANPMQGMTQFPQAGTPQANAQAPQTSQANDYQAKMAALKAELWQAFKDEQAQGTK